jgi:ATP-dependent Clp protease ATP-binding subunit ClpA
MKPIGFDRDSRRIVQEAREVARELAAPMLEAEHLLLAAARVPRTAAHDALAAAGLGYDDLVAGLDAEVEASLAAVGVTLSSFSLPPARPAASTPRWGSSARLALSRAHRIASGRRDRRVDARHLLLGLLRAPAGRVPRALRLAGVDPVELAGRVEAAA